MPEGPEVLILSQLLNDKLKDKYIADFKILKGKYTKSEINNIGEFDKNGKWIIKKVGSHGKLLWFKLRNEKTDELIYMTSHLGLSGFWDFESKSPNIVLTIGTYGSKEIESLCYTDPRSFGNIDIFAGLYRFEDKIKALAEDALQEEYDADEFMNKYKKYLFFSQTRKDTKIFVALGKQNKKDGILSGLGNYLIPEILYDAKISPFRSAGSLTDDEILTLGNSIKFVTKLSYYNNSTGYMAEFGSFIDVHKKGIDNKLYPDYHTDVKLKKTDKFKFKVYQQTEDPLGNPVEKDKTINKGRTVYWVPKIQK